MGFLSGTSAKAIPITALTAEFQAISTLNVIGLLQTYLNDEQRAVFPLSDTAVYGLQPGNPAASMRIPELYLSKSAVHVMAFEQTFSHEEMGLLPRVEHVAVYTSHYVIQGEFYMGTDTMLSDFVDAARTLFIGATNVTVFPLFAPQTAVMQQAALVFVRKDRVQIHHAV